MGFGFVLVDVFTDRPFGGNQLAVFPDAAGIADETMQQLAREFNFSETTFVLPPADPSRTCRVRIFTPRRELPFAGHPTVGTPAMPRHRLAAWLQRRLYHRSPSRQSHVSSLDRSSGTCIGRT